MNPTILEERENDPPRWIVAGLALFLMAAAIFTMVGVSRLAGAGHVIGEREGGGSWVIKDVDNLSTVFLARALFGRPVDLNRVVAGEVIDDYVFWIGGRDEVPVVLLAELMDWQKEERTQICRGDLLRVQGTIREMRDPHNITNPGTVEPEELKNLAKSSVYISATRVEVLQQAYPGGCRM